MRRVSKSLVPFLLPLTCWAADVETHTIKTLPAQMRYDVTELTVTPGAEVKILFENPDDMPHNLVFFQPGTDVVAVCNKQMEKPDEALKRNWLPEDGRMWMHSKTLNPKEREEIVFKAPEKPGDYPYVCSMPGHAMIMRGMLRVAKPGARLTSLHFDLYLGDWKMLPDFASLKPHRSGEVTSNLLELKIDDYKNQYGVVFTGKLEASAAGEYTFELTGDDGLRVLVDGTKVVEYDGIHPASNLKQGKVKLEPGNHDVRVEYFQAAGEAELYVGWSGPGFSMTPLSKWVPPGVAGGKKKEKQELTGFPLNVGEEAVIYRNFIEGAGQRGIGVGYPGHVNIAWSAESMNLALVWRGAFIDAAKHWIDRGGGAQRPLGYDVIYTSGVAAPPFAVLAKVDAEWPKLQPKERLKDYQWKGYTLDARRFPTFQYEWSGVKVTERYEPTGDAASGGGKLVRTLKLEGPIPPGAMFRPVAGAVRPQESGGYLVDGATPYVVEVEGGQVAGNNLLVPAAATLKVTYSWPISHAGHAMVH